MVVLAILKDGGGDFSGIPGDVPSQSNLLRAFDNTNNRKLERKV